MQYFQKANSKQIVGHAATAAKGGADDPAWTQDRAGATFRAASPMARATSILFMTVSFEGHALTARRRLLPDRYGNGRQLPTPAAGLLASRRTSGFTRDWMLERYTPGPRMLGCRPA